MKLIRKTQSKLDDESDLVNQCKAGNNSARKDLYLRYSKRLLVVCYRYCGDVDLAHDLLHDGFIKIYLMINSFEWRGDGSLELWMRRVVANVCLDYLSAQKKRYEIELTDDDGAIVSEEDPEMIDNDSANQLSEDQLLGFIADLPEGYRMVFNLYVFEKKSHKEIGALLGINEHSSTSQLHRAKCMLAKRINDFIKNETKE